VPNNLAYDDVSQMGSPQGSNDFYVDYDDSRHRVSPLVSPTSNSETADRTSGITRVYHPLINGM
jgi:hypothetical protein